MTRRRVYLTNEEAKKANIEKSNMRMMKLYTENPEYKKKHLEEQTKRYYEKKQQFIQLKSQLTLLKSLKSKNEKEEDKALKIENSESLKYDKDELYNKLLELTLLKSLKSKNERDKALKIENSESLKYDNDGWYNKLEQVKQYIDINHKRPSTHDKIEIIKQLGSWVSRQLQNSKNREYIMADGDIYNSWTEFITSDIYKKYFLSDNDEWYNKLELVKQYIDINQKRPSQSDKIEIIKKLGNWFANQLTNSKKKESIMADDDIYNSWTEFITSEQYKKYFLTNNDELDNKSDQVKNYIDINKKRPSSTRDKIEKWYNKLDQVKQYIDINHKKPSSIDKIELIKQLGNWLSYQVNNSKERKHIMSNDDIYKDWTEFITCDIYKKYFKKISKSDESLNQVVNIY